MTDRIDHGSGTGTEAHRSDWIEHDYPSTAIVEAVAAATDRDATALDPLEAYIDSDALDALLTDPSEVKLGLSFTYAGALVRVTGAGSIAVWTDW